MKNIVCIIAYDGSKFCGFSTQKSQPNLLPSVSDFFAYTLRKIGIHAKIIGSGRTDKGVHATYQVINFHAKIYMPLEKAQKLLNDRLYPFVFIRKIYFANEDFHARFSAKMRFYKYIFTQDPLLPFYSHYIAKIKHGDIELIRLALKQFQGTHDFSLFKKNGSETKNFVRTITKATVFKAKIQALNCYVIHVGATGFLRSQVRMMVKACFEFSLDRILLQDLQKQINNEISIHDSKCVRELVPACGLYLSRVVY